MSKFISTQQPGYQIALLLRDDEVQVLRHIFEMYEEQVLEDDPTELKWGAKGFLEEIKWGPAIKKAIRY